MNKFLLLSRGDYMKEYTVVAKDRETNEEIRRVTIPDTFVGNWVETFLRQGYWVEVY
jgi:hypothetical protein